MNTILRLSTCLLVSAALAACTASETGAPATAPGAQAGSPTEQPEAAAPPGGETARVTLTMANVRQYMQALKNLEQAAEADPSIGDPAMNISEENGAQYTARLQASVGLRTAIESAGLSAHEFASIGETLLSAMMAHGAVEAGHLDVIPEGIDPAAVEFVKQNAAELKALMSGQEG